jgi:hypothetical protein
MPLTPPPQLFSFQVIRRRRFLKRDSFHFVCEGSSLYGAKYEKMDGGKYYRVSKSDHVSAALLGHLKIQESGRRFSYLLQTSPRYAASPSELSAS